MWNWPIRNVMTTEVVTARDHQPVADIAAILAERRISAVPIVNRFDVVVGVVSWTDLLHSIDPAERDDRARGRRLRDRSTDVRWPDLAATEVMSAPPVTVRPDASVATAGRLMHQHNIGRLLVTDHAGRLAGIATRRDLLKVHGRLDAVIRDEVAHRILIAEPDNVHVAVDDGVVTLTGHTGRRSTALAVVGLTGTVAGVTGVVDRLTFDADDTVPAPAPQPPAIDPMHGWWAGRRHITVSALPGVTGDIVDEWGRQSFPASDPPTNW